MVHELPETLTHREHHFINGEWSSPNRQSWLDVEDPARDLCFGRCVAGTPDDVDSAVEAASNASDRWAYTPVAERRSALRRYSLAIASRREELATLVTLEMGCPIGLSRVVQADLAVAVLEGFIQAMERLDDIETIGNSMVLREPVGVVAAITPWNYPIYQAVSKIGAALASGCTVVLKPSQVTPLSALMLADAAVDADLPPGVLNIVTGTGSGIGSALTSHPLVDHVSLTGSTAAGSRVMVSAAPAVKRLSLELGGKSANVLLTDADLERAVRRGVEHVMENSGQTCTAWSRMLVPRERQAEVVDIVRQELAALVVGDPFDPATSTGPVATREQRKTVESYVARATAEGAHVAATAALDEPVGHYVAPVAFADVATEMAIAQEEVFGPVLCVMPYDSEAEALAIANDSVYGLSGAVWSRDEERAIDFARRMRTGQVSINGGAFNPAAPFGGYKQSGFGRELGSHGIVDFQQIKAIQR